MNNENEKQYWVRNKLFEYYDPNYAITLSVYSDCNVSTNDNWTSYNSTRIIFNISNSRIESNNKVRIELGYSELYELVNKFLRIFSSDKNFYKDSPVIGVSKSYRNNTKQLVFKYFLDGNGVGMTNINIVNPSSETGTTNINVILPDVKLKPLYKLLKSINDNYASYNNQLLNMCNAERLLDKIDQSENKFMDYLSDLQSNMKGIIINNLNSIQSHNNNTEKYEECIDNIDDSQYNNKDLFDISDNDNLNDNNEIQSNLESFLNDNIDNIELDYNDDNYNDKTNKTTINNNIIVPNNLFVKNFLQFNISNIKEHMAFLETCGDDTDDLSYFNPINYILEYCNISRDEKALINDTDNYIMSQCYNVLITKLNAKNTSFSDEDVNMKYPICKYNNLISNDEHTKELYEITVGVLTCFIVYFIFIEQNINKINNIDSDDLFIHKRAKEFVRNVYMSLFYSLDFNSINKDDFYNECESLFTQCIDYGVFDSLNKIYKDSTLGGKVIFSIDNFRTTFESIYSTKSSGSNNIFSSENTPEFINKIGYNTEGYKFIYNGDIRTFISQEYFSHINVSEEDRFSLFLECSKNMLDKKTLDKLKSNCNDYMDLDYVIKEMRYDLPFDIFKLKRVMDRNIDLNNKESILSRHKNFEENENEIRKHILGESEVIESENDESDDYNFDMIFG